MKVRFSGADKSGFFADVRRQVDQYFKENQISKRANGAMIRKTVFLLASMVTLYYLIITQVGCVRLSVAEQRFHAQRLNCETA